jgi:hypothetical protein
MREEFLELLRTDQAFREELRRQLLTEDVLAMPGRLDHLTELLAQALSLLRDTVGVVQSLTEAQRRTEGGLQQLGERVQALTAAQQRTEEGLQRQGAQIQALIEGQQQLGERVQALTAAQQRTEEGLQRQGAQIQALIEAQERTEGALYRTEEELRELASWQRGKVGRRDGERYEREMLRTAPALFNGGQGGAADQPWVQQRLTELLGSLLAEDLFEPEADPFLADLLWWKGEQVAVVEISLQVNGYDVLRAGKRAETLRRAGAQVLPVVLGRGWASVEARVEALTRHIEWKVGADLSEGFLTFRRVPSG